jgi:hypothetical protein
VRAALNFERREDGSFWMPFSDFQRQFNYLAVNFWMKDAEMVGRKV